MACSGGVEGPIHEMYKDVIDTLEAKIASHKPELLLKNFEHLLRDPSELLNQNTVNLELEVANKVLEELQLIKPSPPQSALHFFDRLNRSSIISRMKP